MTLHSGTSFGSKFSIGDMKLASGPPDAVSFDGSIVKICESICTAADEQDFEPILVTYSIVGGYGLDIPKTVVFNRSATKDGTVISSNMNHYPFVKDGAIHFDLSSDLALRSGLA